LKKLIINLLHFIREAFGVATSREKIKALAAGLSQESFIKIIGPMGESFFRVENTERPEHRNGQFNFTRGIIHLRCSRFLSCFRWTQAGGHPDFTSFRHRLNSVDNDVYKHLVKLVGVKAQ